MRSVHEELISILRSRSQEDENPVDTLTDLFSLSREGAYRRLRGEIQLTLDEAVILAKKLEVSIDNLIEINREDKYAFHILPYTNTTMEKYYQTMEDIAKSYIFVKNDPLSYSYIVGKVFAPTFYFKYKEFTRFTLFRWIHLVQNGTKYMSLSSVAIPPKLENLYQPFIDATTQVSTTHILNDFLFTAVAKDIDYFHMIKLLSKNDVEILKQQMLMIIDDIEDVAMRGAYKNGAKVSIYITDTYFDTSYHYIFGNGFEACGVGAYGLNFLSCQNSRVARDHKIWIESLIKYSTSITQCGEAQRLAFFNKQRGKFLKN